MAIGPFGKVLCCGNISFDIPVWPVDQFQWGATHWVKNISHNVGGNGANTAYTLAKLGTGVRLAGIIGLDARGDATLTMLRNAGVDLSSVRRSDLPTNTSICVVNSSGDRLFLHQVGASADLTIDCVDIEGARQAGCTHFHLANLFALPNLRRKAAALLRTARKAGLQTSLDTGWDADGRWLTDVEPCLPHTDLFFVNETEAYQLTGLSAPDAALEFRRLGADVVIVKLGEAGCFVVNGEQQQAITGFPADVVDTTGAGDCFAGGLLAALSRGLTLPEACRFACAVGALSVQTLGSVTGLLGFGETLEWMRARHTI